MRPQLAYRYLMRLFDSGSFRFAELRAWLLGHVRELDG